MPDESAVSYRTDVSSEWTIENVEANNLAPHIPQGADQRLAKVAGTSCDQDLHNLVLLLWESR
jgi:hypothetical protein